MTINNFSNFTDRDLADACGAIDAQIKRFQERLRAAKAELDLRMLSHVEGGNFVVTRVETTPWTLDIKAVKQEMGEGWVQARSRVGYSISWRITVRKAALELLEA